MEIIRIKIGLLSEAKNIDEKGSNKTLAEC